jgi:DNA (cytosine-5)-methyltransferase 1
MLYLCLQNLSSVWFKHKGIQRINLDYCPCPSITVEGVAAANRSHYWLEEDETVAVQKQEKPIYQVPGMDEIGAIPWNGYSVVSTFSGCGGSCLGFEMAGFKVVWANEFIPAAQEVYRLNHPGTCLNTEDIREVTPESILEATGLGVGELDVMEGSPPCASFSLAGKREEHWGQVKPYSDTKQRTDDLFWEYIRLVNGLQPRVFVAENVAGLVRGVSKGYFKQILSEFKKCGYNVQCQVLDAQWLGVPQARKRVIFMGVREDLGLDPVFPKPLPYYYSVREAIPVDLFRRRIVEPESSIEGYAIGREWEKLRPGESSSRYMNLIRPSLDKPSPTVTQTGRITGAASVTHPTEKRKFSIAELKRICAFPDDFQLTGTYSKQWERLGRAVPPVMMRAVAESIRDGILGQIKA